jgi:cell wall-associated NlpC family hydrolase
VANPSRSRPVAGVLLAAAVAAVAACAAGAGTSSWAAPQVAIVTKVGILGTSPAAFRPQAALTQAALVDATRAADSVQQPSAPTQTAAPAPAPVILTGSFGDGAVLAAVEPLTIDAPGRSLDHVDFAVDGTGVATDTASPFELDLDTAKLADGPHRLAVNAWFAGGGHAISVFSVTIANDDEAAPTTPATVALPIAKSTLPASPTPAPPTQPSTTHTLYRATNPTAPVTMKQLDAALVAYLGLRKAAREIQTSLASAGLEPPASTGTEAVARMLGLRLNHPAADDSLELLPGMPATRAEAAYSFAQVLQLDSSALASVQQAADSFTVPTLTPWQHRILTTAIHYVGYPYVWGGTSPTAETEFGVHSVGGFDCSGFVWRVYKLTPYAGEGNLANTLRGRTTFVMSGEVPRSKRITAAKLQPADVMFFGAKGPKSSPDAVDHTALYLGNGWFVQSSGEGVTLLPFAGYYTSYFAWGRRPLREANLTSS